jgi:hypothetical protein
MTGLDLDSDPDSDPDRDRDRDPDPEPAHVSDGVPVRSSGRSRRVRASE